MIDFSVSQTSQFWLSPSLKIGLYLGYFPSFTNNFQWRSWKVYYSLLIAFILGLYNFISFFWAIDQIQNEGLYNVFLISLSLTGPTINFYILHRIAHKWPILIREWYEIDVTMNKTYGCPKHVKRKIMTITVTFIFQSIINFVLRQTSQYFNLQQKLQTSVSMDMFLENSFPNIFYLLPYNTITGVLSMLLSLQIFILLSFTDTFIMAISIVLAIRFHQITKAMKQHHLLQNEKKSEKLLFWKNLRKDYCKLSDFLFNVDDSFSPLIIYSYGFNFISLLRFLTLFLRGLQPNMFTKIYYYVNAISFIARISSLTLISAKINEHSKEPVLILNSVETNDYNEEVGRLLLQMSFDEVALTGCNLFKLNKSLLLNVISAIVTYELMIIQYHNA